MNTTVPYLRMFAQRIMGAKFREPEEVVRWMGAMQAQDYGQAVWAIGLRTNSATLADIEQAVIDRKILRTWPMRGTIHFVPAEDAKWMVGLSAPRLVGADKRRQAQRGLDETILSRCQKLLYEALSGGKILSRPKIMQLLDTAGISPLDGRGYHILWYLCQTGHLCLGPVQAKQQTFALLDEWVPQSRQLDREESLAELAGRYFMSHGPATIHDFAWWAGLTITGAKRGLEATKAKLTSIKFDDKDHWMAETLPEQLTNDEPDLQLLPGFDEYLLGYKDRTAVLPAAHAEKVVPGNNGVFRPIIVTAGQVTGTWKRVIKKSTVSIELDPFAQTAEAKREIDQSIKRYREFVGMS